MRSMTIVGQIFNLQLDNLERAFEKVRQMLYGRLHDLLRKQIVERVPAAADVAGGMSSSAAPSPVPPVAAQEKKHLSSVAVVTPPALEPVASNPGKC
jgi:arogenate dehydrogenase (NADP+), plant